MVESQLVCRLGPPVPGAWGSPRSRRDRISAHSRGASPYRSARFFAFMIGRRTRWRQLIASDYGSPIPAMPTIGGMSHAASPSGGDRKNKAAAPVLLAGGNPQIAKADGDAPVQAYIAAMPGWKRDIGRGLDALVMSAVAAAHQGAGGRRRRD